MSDFPKPTCIEEKCRECGHSTFGHLLESGVPKCCWCKCRLHYQAATSEQFKVAHNEEQVNITKTEFIKLKTQLPRWRSRLQQVVECTPIIDEWILQHEEVPTEVLRALGRIRFTCEMHTEELDDN